MTTPIQPFARATGVPLGLAVSGLLFTAMVSSQHATSAEITEDEVVKEGFVYHIRFTARADVPADVLLAVLRDYDHYIELSPVIVEGRVLRSEEDGLRLRLTLRPCVFGLCKNLRKVTDVTWLSEDSVEYLGLSGRGDFESSREIITVGEEPGAPGTASFQYHAELVPRFFVPPLIGTWLISRQIREELLGTLNGVEETHGVAR
jgi:hypothetical protein